MADKKLSLGLSIDTKDFDAAIKKMQQDISKLQTPSAQTQKTTQGGPAGSPAYQEFQKQFQASRAQEVKNRNEQEAARIAKRNLEDISRQLATNARLEATSAKTEKERNFYAQERNRLEKEYQTTLSASARIQDQAAKQAKQAKQTSAPASGNMGGVLGMLNTSASSVMAGIYAAIKAGTAIEGVRKTYSEASHRATELQSSAFNMQGQGGQRLNSFLGNGTGEELLFNPERLKASAAADEEMRNRLNSGTRQFTHFGQKLLGKSWKEGGFGTDATIERVKQEQAIERNEIQQKQFEAMKNGPEGALKTNIGSQYLQNNARDLAFQRQMGLSDSSLRGGFTNNATGAGFTQEQGMGMASGIMGAGGSTRASAGLAGFGLQAQRNADMTNAGQVIGKLSGSLGGSETSKDAFIKILAEGTRIGLNQADFVEENRKFTEMAAGVISQSGTSSSAGVGQILDQFGKFFGADKTNTGLEAGKNAYEMYRQMSMAQTGPTGTMRAAGMINDPTLGKLGRESRTALFTMPADQLTEDNPAIMAMAKEAGTTPQKLIDAQNRVTSKSINKFRASDAATQNLSAVKGKFGVSSASGYQGPLSSKSYDELQQALGRSNIQQMMEHPELGMSVKTTTALSEALSSGDTGAARKALESETKNKIEGGTTGRAGDQTEKLQAEASKLANQLFIDMREQIVPTTKAVADFAKEAANLRAVLLDKNATATQKANAITNVFGPAPTAPNAAAPNR